jgi:hypothetical protein
MAEHVCLSSADSLSQWLFFVPAKSNPKHVTNAVQSRNIHSYGCLRLALHRVAEIESQGASQIPGNLSSGKT